MKHLDRDLRTAGLYRPEFEHDACGIGFVANINGKETHQSVRDGLEMLMKLDHRAGKNADGTTGDGAGLMFSIPHVFFKQNVLFSLPEKGEYAVGMCFLPKDVNRRHSVLKKLDTILREF